MAISGTNTKYFYTRSPYSSISSIIASTDNSNNAVFSLTLNWEVTSQDIINNQSTIRWSLSGTGIDLSKVTADTIEFNTPSYIAFGTNDKNISIDYTDIEVHIDNQLIYSTTDFSNTLSTGETKEFCSGTQIISHDSNGNFNDILSAFVRVRNVFDTEDIPAFRYNVDEDFGPGSKASVTSNLIPDAISRKAVITEAPNFTDEDSPTIYYVAPKNANYVQVGISFDGSEMQIPYRTVSVTSTSYNFNFTSSEMNALISYLRTSGPTATVRFYILTSINGTTYTDYVTRTATLIDYDPTLEPEVYDINEAAVALTGNETRLIKYISNAYYSANALAHKGASISALAVKNGDSTLGAQTGTFEGVTSGDFYFSVTDNYGHTVRRTVELELIEYVKLTCSADVGEMTADGDISVTIRGKYFNSTFGAVQNTLSLSYSLSKNNGEPVTYVVGQILPTMVGNNYSYTFEINGLDYKSVYELGIDVSDKAMPDVTHTEVILASEPIFDWGRNDFNFNVPVSFNNVPMMDFVVENGVNGNWRWRKWNSGIMEAWGFIKGTVDVTTQWGGVYRSNESIQDYFPISFVDYPTVQATPSYDNYGNYWLATHSTQSGMNKTPSYQICLGENALNVNYKISFYAIGK